MEATRGYPSLPWGLIDELVAQPERLKACDMGTMPDKISVAAVTQYAEIARWILDEIDTLGYHNVKDEWYAVERRDDRRRC